MKHSILDSLLVCDPPLLETPIVASTLTIHNFPKILSKLCRLPAPHHGVPGAAVALTTSGCSNVIKQGLWDALGRV